MGRAVAALIVVGFAATACGGGEARLAQQQQPSEQEGVPCSARRIGNQVVIDLDTCGSSTTTTTTTTVAATTTIAPSTSTTTSTVAPSTSTATTVLPATTTSTAAPTTAAPTTSVAPATSSTTSSTTPAPTTTQPSGVAFSEDFSTPQAFYERFDHGWSGELQAGLRNGDETNDWPGDHSMSCGDPNTTRRTIHIGPLHHDLETGQQNPAAAEQAFYYCAPGNDPARGHVMTSVNTSGYIAAWFAPKPTFTDVRRVCWDQNLNRLGGGKWAQILFLTAAEVQRAGRDLGYTSPEFPGPLWAGPSTAMGASQFGLRILRNAGVEAWQNGSFTGQTVPAFTTTDKAPRYQHCVVDLENGRLDVTITSPTGLVVRRAQVAGSIPNGPIRVVFSDDNYHPDKHFDFDGAPSNSTDLYTWHWDNVQIS